MITRIFKSFKSISLRAFFISLCISNMSLSQSDSTNVNTDSLNNIETQLIELFEYCKEISRFSGSVLIAWHGKIVFEKSFGFADIDKGILNTPQTNFNVASTTKPFTAMTIAVLKDKRKLNFDDPVNHYLSEFPYPAVTIRHLLTHTSGLPDYLHSPPFFKYHGGVNSDSIDLPPFTNLDILKWLVKSGKELDFEPGSKIKYCNTGYVMLALIVEKVSGQKFADYLKDNVLIPSGMTNSLMYNLIDNPPIKNRAMGYIPTLDRTSFVYSKTNRMDGIIGDAGLYSSVEDLFKFDQALYENLIVSRETLNEIFTPCQLNNGQKKGYGLGWILKGYDNSEPFIVKHGGKGPGVTVAFQRLVEDSSTIIILTNCDLTGPTIGSIRDAASDILQGKTPELPKFPIVDIVAEVLFKVSADSAVILFHYLRDNVADRYFIDEHQLNILGYNLMYENRLEDARKIFEANADAYPESSNVYDSLGDFYKYSSDLLKAIEYYKKALSIDPELKHTLKKLKEISGSGK